MEESKAKKIDIGSNDRISKLPEDLLHRILCLLDLKAAIRTCVLSKSWRYLWCSRSEIDINFRWDDGTDSPAFLDRFLQAFHHRNLHIDEFNLRLSKSYVDRCGVETASVLNKWIPVIIHDMRVKKFSLTLDERPDELAFEVPSLSLIFASPHIRFISLTSCTLRSTTTHFFDSKLLRSLILWDVYIPEELLDNVLSNCPLIRNVWLEYCKGFTRIKAFMNTNNNMLTNLARFVFLSSEDEDISIEIGDHIQTLQTIEIQDCLFSVSRHKPFEFASLRQLILTRVYLSSESFSCNLHCLEELKLDECSGIEVFKLSSQSMKILTINNVGTPFKAAIDAPSIVSFHYEGILPQSIYFARTTSNHWKSNINLGTQIEPPHRFSELYGLLEALSQSEISLPLDQVQIIMFGTQLQIGDDNDDVVGVSEEDNHELLPAAVKHLTINTPNRNARFKAATFLNMLFRMFRPSFVYMGMDMLTCSNYERTREIVEVLFKKRGRTILSIHESYIWERVLEGVGLQVLYKNQSEWKPVKHTRFRELSKKAAMSNELELRFHLKWRD